MGLEKILKEQLNNPNEQMKKQIQYILDELNEESEVEEKNDEDFEDENYGDEEENYNEDEFVRMKFKSSMKKNLFQMNSLFCIMKFWVII